MPADSTSLAPRPRQALSQRRIDANRRNARKSTGPRTPEGKARAALNGTKHACSNLPILPCESDADYERMKAELHEEMQPSTPLQMLLITQIAQAFWRIGRLADAERDLFLAHANRLEDETGQRPPPCTLLARSMNQGPGNGLSALSRYRISEQNALLKLMRQFYWQKKHHPHLLCTAEEAEQWRQARRESESWKTLRQQEQIETERQLRETGQVEPLAGHEDEEELLDPNDEATLAELEAADRALLAAAANPSAPEQSSGTSGTGDPAAPDQSSDAGGPDNPPAPEPEHRRPRLPHIKPEQDNPRPSSPIQTAPARNAKNQPRVAKSPASKRTHRTHPATRKTPSGGQKRTSLVRPREKTKQYEPTGSHCTTTAGGGRPGTVSAASPPP